MVGSIFSWHIVWFGYIVGLMQQVKSGVALMSSTVNKMQIAIHNQCYGSIFDSYRVAWFSLLTDVNFSLLFNSRLETTVVW